MMNIMSVLDVCLILMKRYITMICLMMNLSDI